MSSQLPLASAGAGAVIADDARRAWVKAGLPLAVGVTVLAVTYAPEMSAAVRVWIDSTAYSHGFLVLPVAAYLLYTRWDAVAASVPEAVPLMAAAAVPVAFCWFIAERIGIMEARQLLAMALLQILVMAVLGLRNWRVLSAPLLYLFFLVPVGEFTAPWLQGFTARFIDIGLDVARIPHFVDGTDIEIPEGRFLVAEACAGLRFLIASVAFGVFYACIFYVSPARRAAFIALSLIVPVLANGFRALGIVVLGHVLGSTEAAAVDHVLYGWMFFTIVTAALILLGLPYRQSRQEIVRPGRPPRPARSAGAAVAVVVVAASALAPRLLADTLDNANTLTTRSGTPELRLSPAARCLRDDQPLGGFSPVPTGFRPASIETYRCGNNALVLRLMAFPPDVGAAPVFRAFRGASTVPGWDEVARTVLTFGEGKSAPTWLLVDSERENRFVTIAAGLWIDGQPSAGGIAGRFRQATAAFRADAVPPIVAVVLSEPTSDRESSRSAIERFLRDADGLRNLVGVPPAQGATRLSPAH